MSSDGGIAEPLSCTVVYQLGSSVDQYLIMDASVRFIRSCDAL